MKTIFLIVLIILNAKAWSFTGDGMPFKYISSCEIDLNGDSQADKALLIEGISGRELIALIANKKGYDAFIVSTGKEHMFLSCKFGAEVKETAAGGGIGRIVKAPGAFLELVKPESSSVAFVWSNGSFKEVWTSD